MILTTSNYTRVFRPRRPRPPRHRSVHPARRLPRRPPGRCSGRRHSAGPGPGRLRLRSPAHRLRLRARTADKDGDAEVFKKAGASAATMRIWRSRSAAASTSRRATAPAIWATSACRPRRTRWISPPGSRSSSAAAGIPSMRATTFPAWSGADRPRPRRLGRGHQQRIRSEHARRASRSGPMRWTRVNSPARGSLRL